MNTIHWSELGYNVFWKQGRQSIRVLGNCCFPVVRINGKDYHFYCTYKDIEGFYTFFEEAPIYDISKCKVLILD
jgi:hypothetical protein